MQAILELTEDAFFLVILFKMEKHQKPSLQRQRQENPKETEMCSVETCPTSYLS